MRVGEDIDEVQGAVGRAELILDAALKPQPLYLNPVRMEGIVGMPDDAAQALIAELMTHSTQSKYEYRHRWEYGDMVIWDNRSVMHQANADYDMKEQRRLYRLMIKGRLHPSDVDAIRDVRIDTVQRVPA